MEQLALVTDNGSCIEIDSNNCLSWFVAPNNFLAKAENCEATRTFLKLALERLERESHAEGSVV